MKYQTEIKQCIKDFQTTLISARDCSTIKVLLEVAEQLNTEDGICSYIEFNIKDSTAIKIYLDINESTFMFKDKIFGINSIFLLGLNDDNSRVMKIWREIAIDLCQQRIDYLKKFLHHG
jgi:hypothetical protein